MSTVVHSLVRRGVQVASHHLRNKDRQAVEIEMPKWGFVVLAVTTLFFFVFAAGIRYTYGQVVATLAMIETPTATAIIRTSELDSEDPDAPLLSPDEKTTSDGLVQQELLLINAKPITASLRGTVRHLRSRAGRGSRFRGVGLFMLYGVLYNTLASVFGDVRRPILANAIAHFLTTVILCRVNMAWTHAVIAEPNGKSSFRRIVGGHLSKKIVGPTAFFALLEQLAILSPVLLATSFHLPEKMSNISNLKKLSKAERNIMMLQYLAVLLSALFNLVFVFFPAHVSLKRVQASLLPEEDEAIIPFDRTFGGTVVPAIVGGTGRVSIRGAWATFDWNARIRVVKVYAKMMAMLLGVGMIYVFVMAAEIRVILGPQIDKLILAAKMRL